MTHVYEVGFDFGNGEAKLTLLSQSGQMHSLSMPSVTADGSLHDLQEMRGASGMHDHPYRLGEDDYVLSFAGEDRHMGHLALAYAPDVHETRNNNSRYWSRESLEFLLALSGALIFDQEYHLLVVTGLPAETINAANKKKVIDALSGSHLFTLNGMKRIAHIHVAKVVQEGAGGIVLYGTAEPIKQAVIDIGARTTDVYTTIGQEPVRRQCLGYNVGVSDAGMYLSDLVEGIYDRELTLNERRTILRAHISMTHLYPDIPVGGRSVPPDELSLWAAQALRKKGKLIRGFIDKVYGNEKGRVGMDLKRAVLIGGGAYYFLQDIQESLPFAVIGEEAEYANSRSYAQFARRYAALAAAKVGA